MSASLRSPKPTGIRRPVPGPDQQRASEPCLAAHERCALPDSSCPDGRVEQDALAERPERLSDWPTTPKPRLTRPSDPPGSQRPQQAGGADSADWRAATIEWGGAITA